MDHTLNTTPPTLGLEEGQAAFKNGDWAQSLALAGQFLEHHNDSIAGWMLKARSLVQLGQWDAAHEAFAQVLHEAPADYNAWLETGHLHFAQGQFAQASTAYERAVALSNERFEAHLALARVALVNGQQAMAERLYAKAIQAAQGVDVPTQRLVHWRMGQYLLDAGHAQEATVSFSDALLWLKDVNKPAARNHVAEVQMDWACALMRLDQRERALQLFTSAAAMASRENTLTRLAVLNQQHHFEEQALAVARRCVQLFPQSSGAHLNLAHVLMESGQLAAAEGVLAQAESLRTMPGATDLRAALATKLGDAPKPAP